MMNSHKEFFSGKRGGVMVFSASKGRQYSYESPDIGTGAGVFTYAIIQGLGQRVTLQIRMEMVLLSLWNCRLC